MTDKIKLGKLGEQITAEYLAKYGYQILKTNYHTREGEIDLICQKDKTIIFVEVKTRTNQNFGWPEEAVTDEKLEKIIIASLKYLQENGIEGDWQIDVISIIFNETKRIFQLKHLENVSSWPAFPLDFARPSALFRATLNLLKGSGFGGRDEASLWPKD